MIEVHSVYQQEREGTNKFVCDISLYVAETPKASIKDYEPLLPIMPFGIVAFGFVGQPVYNVHKAMANEDTLLPTQMFPRLPPRATLLLTQILCPGHKNVSDFVQKHFVSATNVSQFAQSKKHYGQQCVRNNVSSFTRAYRQQPERIELFYIFSGLSLSRLVDTKLTLI